MIVGRYFTPLLALLIVSAITDVARATGDVGPITDPAISGPVWDERDQWRTKIQQVFDVRTRILTRRFYQVWDPEPSRDLDFLWTPDWPDTDQPGRLNGSGHLVWRIR